MTTDTTARVSGAITPEALIDLIGELGREAYWLLDDCETSSGPDGAEVHQITTEGLEKLSAALDRIEALPFSEENVILGPGAMLQLALRQTFLAVMQPDPESQPVAWFCGGCGETDPAKRCLGCLHVEPSPATPSSAGSVEAAAQVLLEWWNKEAGTASDARKIVAVVKALSGDDNGMEFDCFDAALRALTGERE